MADIKIVGGSSGSGGRGDCGEGCQQPQQPPFVEDVEIWVYARLDGSDCDGDGSLCNPYRTFMRAIRDVPTEVSAGVYYHVDITGLGAEKLTQGYTFPPFRGADDVAGVFDFDQEFFSCKGIVNIQADPQLATGVTGLTTIAAGSFVPDPTTGMQVVHVPGAGWTNDQLVGKFWINNSVGPLNAVIWKNDTEHVWLTQSAPLTGPIYPARIMEPSANLYADRAQTPLAPVPDLHYGAVNVFNAQVALLGLKINATPTVPSPTDLNFQNFGLHISGTTPRVSMQLCDLKAVGVTTDGWGYVRICYLPQALFLNAPLLIINSLIHRSMDAGNGTNGIGLTFFGARGVDSLCRQTVFLKCNTLMFRDLFDTFAAATVPNLLLVQCQFMNQTGSLPLGKNAQNFDGIRFVGSFLRMIHCDVSRDDGQLGGSAIVAQGNCTQVSLMNVTGKGYARFGCEVIDGANVEVNDLGLGATNVTGAMGDVCVGSVPPLPGTGNGWALVANVYPPPPAVVPPNSSVVDYGGANAQGCRLWRAS